MSIQQEYVNDTSAQSHTTHAIFMNLQFLAICLAVGAITAISTALSSHVELISSYGLLLFSVWLLLSATFLFKLNRPSLLDWAG